MPVVTADGRVLYDGPSEEDAHLVMDLARELGVWHRELRWSPGGSPEPRGPCGRALREADERERRAAVREALAAWRPGIRRAGRERRPWDGEPSPDPPACVVKRLLAASASGGFEAARREWEYRGEILEEGHPEFSRECDLCGPKELMRANYLIRNVLNGRILKVGSVCVKRFLILDGASSVAESAALFDRRTALAEFGRRLQGLIADLGADEVPERSLVALMGALERAFPEGLSPEDAAIAAASAGADARAWEVFGALAARDARALRGLKVRKMADREDRRRRVREVLTTLARSEAYRDPGRTV